MEALNKLERSYFKYKGKAHFLSLVKDPQNTEEIFRMTDSIRRSNPPEVIERMMENVFKDPILRKAFENKYWPKMPSLEELKAMPEGSFGKEFAIFFERWNLDPDFYPEPKLDTPSEYLLSRVYQAHDAWHVLTGYTPSVKDELALQAFGVAQYKQPISTLIIAGGFLHMLNNNPQDAVDGLEAVSEGYARGKRALNLLSHPVLERFADPLEDVRRDLNIE